MLHEPARDHGPALVPIRARHDPLPALDRGARRRTATYRFRSHDEAGQVVRLVRCEIPATERAVAIMDRRLGVKRKQGGRTEQSVLMGDVILLPGLEVNVCQYGGMYPHCDPEPPNLDDGIGPPPEEQICYDWTGCDGGGPDTGGTDPEVDPDPDPDQPEPCNTSNPMINADSTQSLLFQLWRDSNPTATDQFQRSEQASFIVRKPDGSYSYQRFPASWYGDQCTLNIPLGTVPPAGTVGVVHTHPWQIGEEQLTCGPAFYIGSEPVYANYNGKFSEPDQQVLAEFERVLGYQLTGYFIDFEGIKEFTDTSATVDVNYGRCAY